MGKSNPRGDQFECLRDALIVRKKVTNVLKLLSLQSQKRIESLSATWGNATSDEQRAEITEKLREERFNQWLIQDESRIATTACAGLSGALITANTIYPTYMEEFTERRVHMDKALGACNVLQDELQYIAEAVYADKNKFTALVLEIEALFRKIKSVRQADNRFLKEIKNR